MTNEEKAMAIANAQKAIDSLPYKSTIPYPYCCLCFERLTPDNIHENEEGLINVCIDCKDL